MKDSKIIMQTKNYHGHTWKDLSNCNRSTFLTNYSIQCEIDRNNIRWMYHLRVIKAINATHNEIMINKLEKGHYQMGILCYPNHGIRNLTASNVTCNSVDVSWMFYSWDIKNYLIESTEFTVNENGKPISTLTIDLDTSMKLNRTQHVPGLHSCTRYSVTLLNEYSYKETRESTIYVTTRCPDNPLRMNFGTFREEPTKILNRTVVTTGLLLLFCVIISLSAYCVLAQRRKIIRRTDSEQTDIPDTETKVFL